MGGCAAWACAWAPNPGGGRARTAQLHVLVCELIEVAGALLIAKVDDEVHHLGLLDQLLHHALVAAPLRLELPLERRYLEEPLRAAAHESSVLVVCQLQLLLECGLRARALGQLLLRLVKHPLQLSHLAVCT